MDLLSFEDRTRRLIRTEYMLAANRLTRPRPWHSGGRRWTVSASTVTMAEREARLVPSYTESCPPSFWSLHRSEPAKPGLKRARTAHVTNYAEKTRFKPVPYRAEPCTTGESLRQCLNNEFLRNFDAGQLRRVETAMRNTLPTQKTISEEKQALTSERGHLWARRRDTGLHRYTSPERMKDSKRMDSKRTDSKRTDNTVRRTDTSNMLHTKQLSNDDHKALTDCLVCKTDIIHK